MFARYLLAVCGLALTGVTMAGNVLFAWSMAATATPMAVAMFMSVSATADLIPVAMVAIIPKQHYSKSVMKVLLAFAIWAVASGFSIYSCAEWFRTSFEPAEAASAMTADKIETLNAEIASTRAHLEEARDQSLKGATYAKRRDARIEADRTRERLTKLEGSKWPAMVQSDTSPILKHGFRGHELVASFVIFILAQMCWFFAFDDSPVSDGESSVKPIIIGGMATTKPTTTPFQMAENNGDRVERDDRVVPFRKKDTPITDMRKNGMTWVEICQELKVSESTARRRFQSEVVIKNERRTM